MSRIGFLTIIIKRNRKNGIVAQPPVKEYSTRDSFEDDAELTDDQLRQLLGFRPRQKILNGTSFLAQFRGA